MHENLSEVSVWCNHWGFKINLEKKTVAVLFSRRRISDIHLFLNNQPVKIDNKAKFLVSYLTPN